MQVEHSHILQKHDQPVSQNEQAKKDTADATQTQSAKAESKHEQNESRSANKRETTITQHM